MLNMGPSILSAGIDFKLSPPPGAQETEDELDWLEFIQARLRDDRTRRLIVLETQADPVALFLDAGLIPSRVTSPELWTLLEMTSREASYFVLREKSRYARLRPTQLRPQIGSVIPVPGHPSYPSGHATQVYAVAFMLSRLKPDCAPVYERLAADVAIRREIAGVHFPSDTRSGEELAKKLVDAVLEVPEVARLPMPASLLLLAHADPGTCWPVIAAHDGSQMREASR